MRLCLSAQEYADLVEKILLSVTTSEIGRSTNIVPITQQLVLIGFSLLGILSFQRSWLILTSIWEQWGLLTTVTITIN